MSSCLSVELMWSARDAEDAGTAKRRRERRLRQFLRHERCSWPGQTQARSGREAREVLHGQVPGAPLPEGGRPAPLPEVAGWQKRIQQHTGEQMIDDLPYVQILDAPVPQVVDSAMDFFRRLDLPVAELVIDVPMISSSSCSSRAVLQEPQMAEQLVDVPIQHIVELLLQHLVDIPVLQVGVSGGGQQGFSLWTGFGRRADR